MLDTLNVSSVAFKSLYDAVSLVISILVTVGLTDTTYLQTDKNFALFVAV
jgi:hypothetical protein